MKGIHQNSVAAYWAGSLDLFGKRHRKIIECFRAHRDSMTDREVMVALGFSDPNSVRPRITELTEAGIIEERGGMTCPITKKWVRRSKLRVAKPEPQFEMAEILSPEIIGELKERSA